MPASEAQIQANQRNAQRSTGPKTPEGKEQSRRNSLKHGLTGAGVVLPESDAAEVNRKAAAYARELNASDEVEVNLARRAALNAVRMDRAADQQTAALSERIRQIEAEFVAPEGVSAEEAARLKAEAVRIAMFDTSKEATQARRYEAAAERNFFKALKELRQLKRQASTPSPAKAAAEAARKSMEQLASFFPAVEPALAKPPSPVKPAPAPVKSTLPTWTPTFGGAFDVPITIGRAR